MSEDLKDKKVLVKNLNSGVTVYKSDSLRVRREWGRKGQLIPIPAEELKEVLYDNAVFQLFNQGYLGIENKEDRILVGLDNPDIGQEVEPFTVEKAKKLLNGGTLDKVFEQEITGLKSGEIETLVSTAVETKDTSYNKKEIIKKLYGVNIDKLIENLKEDDKKENN